jgi:hypothetical protein
MLSRLALVLGLTACASGSALAESPGFCNQYASKALADVQQARSNPRCNTNLHPGVFSTDFNVHYNWCLRVDSKRAYAGTDQREAHLRRCSAASGPGRPEGPATSGLPKLSSKCGATYRRYLSANGNKSFAVSQDGQQCGYADNQTLKKDANSKALGLCYSYGGANCRILNF